MGFIEHFACGALAGWPLMYILSRRRNWALIAPFSLIICGIWAALPYLLITILHYPGPSVMGLDSNMFFFYTLLDEMTRNLSFEIREPIAFSIIWISYCFVCVYYIRYAKTILRLREARTKDAQ